MITRRNLIISIVTIALYGLTWHTLRLAMTERLTVAAQRDLQTIVDLVSADLERSAGDYPEQKGASLLLKESNANREMFLTLQRAGEMHYRSIYFFDAGGSALQVGKDFELVTTDSSHAPRIVQQARELALVADSPGQGAVFEAYDDREGQQVIGAWRWLPSLALGVVAERPYKRFVQPVAWVDGIFVALLLLAAAYRLRATIDAETLRAFFCNADVKICGPYEIKRKIGEGAMSDVYLAQHRRLKRVVALKRLKIQARTDELAARFEREVRLASQLSHPNIVTVLDHGMATDGGFYYTMEFIDGLTLTQWVEQHGPVPPARVVRILLQICAAVGAMHHRSLLHRDIKPNNVMAYSANGDFDLVKLLDFGLIKDLENMASRDLTRDARILGTPAFMAPERLLDPGAVDPRTDLYGIGCIGFYLLTGRNPFESTRDADLAQQVLHVNAPAVSSLSVFRVPESLDHLIASALAKEMSSRPRDAAAFAEALVAIRRQVPWNRERARLWWMSIGPADARTDADSVSGPPVR